MLSCPDSNRSGRSPIPGIREATAACWQSSQLLHALLLLSAPALDGASVSMDNAQEQVRAEKRVQSVPRRKRDPGQDLIKTNPEAGVQV